MNQTVADPAPPGDVLAKLTGVGKDYPVFASRTSRLKTIARILLGRETDHYHRALNGIDLTIRRGESWGVIGENGAGKSTMLKLIAGVSLASRGQCEVKGRTAALLELGAGFHPEYSGRENVFLAAALMGWTQADTAARMDDILAFADIGEAIEQPLKTYSTGMAVRLGFALVTATRPELLVTDEVLAVGDESFQKKCLRWMERYLADGGSLVFCSHSMYHVQSLCQKALWLHHGECREAGEAFEVTHHYLSWHEAKLGGSDGAPRAAATDTHVARMLSLRTTRADGTPTDAFELGEDIVLEGTYHSPDDRSTIVMSGIARIDGTPIYGTLSSDDGFESERLGPQRFGFRFVLPGQPLLPGKYRFKTHTLDNQGLRMFDTQEVEATVSGKTRDHGLVRLDHRWLPLGRPGP